MTCPGHALAYILAHNVPSIVHCLMAQYTNEKPIETFMYIF